ncbi:JAB1/Mov34/MPN/PAD-1 ubiquitin protease domain-containing protein [Ditylenchus destructor]|uniref:26S proteasome non-ATPase regulatory subunit 7 n=1 Tax=Ditylenchus destructor TaxID=166010 RepID=A0AAD4N2U3_9BILA|nr:JAB1/Mov34/MPN/PAD-1 ubiquitin protease domain-containing protein [Ditylenchus destructor]
MAPHGKDDPTDKTSVVAVANDTVATEIHCLSTVHHDLAVKKVVVHPLVLLSVVDHFNRVSHHQNVKRVVGVLLGSMKADKTLDIANSFAVPFDEEDKDRSTFFLDTDYLESMYSMFYKVAAREKIVGWYHTGPKLCKNDIAINDKLKKFTPNPVLVIIQAEPKDLGLPTDAYIEVQEVHDDGTPPVKTFEHVPSDIAAEEAEEVGVEHLLRDIKDQTAGTLSQRITNQVYGLRGLLNQLADIQRYLREVSRSELPVNHAVVYFIQELLNLLPDVTTPEMVDAQNIQTNNQLMCVYLGSLVRAVISHHNLIDNKLYVQKAEDRREESANANEKAKNASEKAAKKKDSAAAKGDSAQ